MDGRIASYLVLPSASLPPRPVSIAPELLPFVRPEDVDLSSAAPRLVVPWIDRAFPNRQVGGTRLVLTQSTYILQKWVDALGARGRIVLSADRGELARSIPEALERRGPWALFEWRDREPDPRGDAPLRIAADLPFIPMLVRAYHSGSADERLQLCRDASLAGPDSPVAALALASACREHMDMAGARDALDRARELAPAWEAVHFEDGKFWLAYDDLERASKAFRRAADAMPTFSAAFSNLGATLGEIDRPDEALAAFRQALAHDPLGHTILNNIGVVSRELGRLDESEAALRRVVELAPAFVFGHYNLGHTLFLAGRYADALAAYEEGQRRDPVKNRRQGCRLAVVRFANGDRPGAERDLWRFAEEAPPEEREDLLLEAYEIVRALVAARRDLDPDGAFLDAIASRLA